MDCTGKLVSVSRDWQTKKLNITFQLNEEPVNDINELATCEKLRIEVDKYKEKRSKDANSYAWLLMQKIAEATQSDKWTVYLEMLQRYSREFTHIICKENAVDTFRQLYRTCIDLGEVNINGTKGHQLQVYYGSSTFDTKAMSVFIDGIVSECKELDIDVVTPDELERMKSLWNQ